MATSMTDPGRPPGRSDRTRRVFDTDASVRLSSANQ